MTEDIARLRKQIAMGNEQLAAAMASTSVDDALAIADQEPANGDNPAALKVLAAEVRRLREESRLFREYGEWAGAKLSVMTDEVIKLQLANERLREERDLFREAGEAAELRVLDLGAEVARCRLLLDAHRLG